MSCFFEKYLRINSLLLQGWNYQRCWMTESIPWRFLEPHHCCCHWTSWKCSSNRDTADRFPGKVEWCKMPRPFEWSMLHQNRFLPSKSFHWGTRIEQDLCRLKTHQSCDKQGMWSSCFLGIQTLQNLNLSTDNILTCALKDIHCLCYYTEHAEWEPTIRRRGFL